MKEYLKCGGQKKFVVWPLKYVDTPYYQDVVSEISRDIVEIRESEGKEPYPEYIVINTDEPYIQEIIDVLKKHNHWGNSEVEGEK